MVKAGPNSRERTAKMVPLYAARIEDLGPGDFAKVATAACVYTGNIRRRSGR